MHGGLIPTFLNNIGYARGRARVIDLRAAQIKKTSGNFLASKLLFFRELSLAEIELER